MLHLNGSFHALASIIIPGAIAFQQNRLPARLLFFQPAQDFFIVFANLCHPGSGAHI